MRIQFDAHQGEHACGGSAAAGSQLGVDSNEEAGNWHKDLLIPQSFNTFWDGSKSTT
jgi:hypothetical protein